MIGRLLNALALVGLGYLLLMAAPTISRFDHGPAAVVILSILWVARAWSITRPKPEPADQVLELIRKVGEALVKRR